MFDMGMISVFCRYLHGKSATAITAPRIQVFMLPIENNCLQSTSSFAGMLVKGVLFAAVLMLTTTPLCAADQDRIASLHSSVSALNSARQTALDELENLSLSVKETSDYRDFIVYLNTRITNDCRELAEQGGDVALEGLNCPANSKPAGTSTAQFAAADNIFYTTGIETTESHTQAEKTSELDGGFLSTLGEFDEMLLKEEDKIAARVPSQRESSSQAGLSGSDSNSGDAGETGSGEEGEAGEQGEGTEGRSSPDGQEGQSGASTGAQGKLGAGNADVDHSAYGAPGGKLPPPEDDDIVARQLREAAGKEPDPELKKKLWEEYWKYKGVNK